MFKNVFKNKTVLITGATGFKGSWLAIWLKFLGAKVIGYALNPKTKRDNFVVCGLDKKITFIKGDVRDLKKLKSVFKKHKPMFAFHLAAQPLVLDSYKDPHYTFETNVLGTVNFFEAVRHTPSVKVALNITSDKCYDNRDLKISYKETDPFGGKDPYSASKGTSEVITYSYANSFFQKKNSAHIASVRAGNVIGGGDWANDRIIPDCIRAFFSNKPVVVRNPRYTRPWQHVLEPLSGYLTLASKLYTFGKKYSGGWNFGPNSKSAVEVKTIVQEVLKQWGSGQAKYLKSTSSAPKESKFLQLNINKAKKVLKWHPVLNYKKTIQMTLEEYNIRGWSKEKVYNQRIQHIKEYSHKR